MKLYLIIDEWNNSYYIVAKTIEETIKIASEKIKENDKNTEIIKIELITEKIITGEKIK